MNVKTVWDMPYPSSWGAEPELIVERGRALRLEIVDPSGEQQTIALRFADVQAFKCTYLPALTAEFVTLAYDKLVETTASRLIVERPNYKCYVICFDDGPCYEIVAADFQCDPPVVISKPPAEVLT